jgi:hypothetical protein
MVQVTVSSAFPVSTNPWCLAAWRNISGLTLIGNLAAIGQLPYPGNHAGPGLGVDDAVQVQGWRFDRGLTQHDMDLPSMVRLMIKQMGAGYMRRFHIVFALIVCVRE